ncbi:MAG: YrbL family protein [Carboxylicivirga sp.]|nr:YrbL family protein [Carboxylicivirga sp.]
MIKIDENKYIGRGQFQKCYVHPENENICLKIKVDPNHVDPRVDREIKYYKKIQKKAANLSFLAKYHGEVETNLGMASAFDLIRDETTNNVSLSLYSYLRMEKSPFSHELFIAELEKLKQKLIQNKIVARDLSGANICCKILKDNSIEMVLIDGVGHTNVIPLVEWFRRFTKRKMDKVFMEKNMHSMQEHLAYLNLRFEKYL